MKYCFFNPVIQEKTKLCFKLCKHEKDFIFYRKSYFALKVVGNE